MSAEQAGLNGNFPSFLRLGRWELLFIAQLMLPDDVIGCDRRFTR